MLVPYIRSSSYGNWSFCKLQYYQIYVLGYQNKTGLKAELGTATHKVMEVLGVCKKILQDGGKQTFTDDAIGEVKFNKKGLYTDKFVDQLISRSYEAYKAKSENDDFNPDKFKVKIGDEQVKDTFRFVEKQVYMALNNWNGLYDVRNRTIVDMEPHFDLPINEDWAHFTFKKNGETHKGQLAIKGTIDTVTSLDDDTIEVIDWKTGQRIDFATGEEKDYAKLCNDPQLLLYNHAISRLYPTYNNRIMTINFIRDGGPFSMCFEDEDDERFIDMLRDRFKEITTATKLEPISQSRGAKKPGTNKLKDWKNGWKCAYLCKFSEIDPETGQSRCKNVEDTIKLYGIDEATKKLKNPDFDPTFYSAPG